MACRPSNKCCICEQWPRLQCSATSEEGNNSGCTAGLKYAQHYCDMVVLSYRTHSAAGQRWFWWLRRFRYKMCIASITLGRASWRPGTVLAGWAAITIWAAVMLPRNSWHQDFRRSFPSCYHQICWYYTLRRFAPNWARAHVASYVSQKYNNKVEGMTVVYMTTTFVYDNNIWCIWVRIISCMLQYGQFQYSPQADNERDHVTDLTSAELHEKSEIYIQNVATRELPSFWSFIFLRKIGLHWHRCKVAAFCDRAEVYLWRHWSVVTWPDMTIKQNFTMSGLNRTGQSCQSSAHYRKRLWGNREKTVWGGVPPPRPARVTIM